MKMRADECSSPPGLMCVDQGAGKRKAGPLLGGGSQRAPGLTMIRLYYRDGPERIPQMSDFFAERVRNTQPAVPLLSHVGSRTNRGSSVQKLRSPPDSRTQ